MIMIPTRFTVTVRELVEFAEDVHGNPTIRWSEGEWRVHGIAPGAMQDTDDQNREKSLVAWTVFGPKVGNYPRSPRAEIRLPGIDTWFPVNGTPDDWTMGPWVHPFAGLSVALLKVEG